MSRSFNSAMTAAALVLLAAVCCGAAPLQQRGSRGLQDILRRIILEGDADLGIPVLDPFTLSYVNGSTDNAIGELSNVVVTGLGDFVAEEGGAIGVGQVTVKLQVAVPKLLATGDYDFDGVFQINGGDSHLYGAGPIEIDLEDITVNAEVSIRLGLTGLHLRSLNIELGLGDIEIRMHGLLWGGLVDDFLSSVATELAGELFEEQRPALEEALENAIQAPLEEALDELSWGDLLCILFNQCEEKLITSDRN